MRIVVDNKLRAYGETDLNKGLIRINKKRHFNPKYKMTNPTGGGPKKDLASTIHHELLHVKHPDATEKSVRKMEKRDASKMTPQRQKQLLALIKK